MIDSLSTTARYLDAHAHDLARFADDGNPIHPDRIANNAERNEES